MITGDENSDDEISDDEISDDEISCDEISDDEISDDEISGNPFLIQIYRFDRFAKNKHFKITSSTLPRFSNVAAQYKYKYDGVKTNNKTI